MCRVRSHLFIEPQLATAVNQPPLRSGWIHEIKHDGYRTIVVIERGEVRCYTRNGFDWSHRYPGILQAASGLQCRSAVLDGEVIIQNDHGVSDFDGLMSAIRWRPQKLIFYAFDLLHLDGKDLRDLPLIERRGCLQKLLQTNKSPALQFSEEFVGDAAAFFQACATHRLEGMVSKLASSRYRSGRSKTWLKCKCFTESSFVIIGTERDRKTSALLALLARSEDEGLCFHHAAGGREGRTPCSLRKREDRSASNPAALICPCSVDQASDQGPRSPSRRREEFAPRNFEGLPRGGTKIGAVALKAATGSSLPNTPSKYDPVGSGSPGLRSGLLFSN